MPFPHQLPRHYWFQPALLLLTNISFSGRHSKQKICYLKSFKLQSINHPLIQERVIFNRFLEVLVLSQLNFSLSE